jgi:hypothetical protein
LGQCSQGIQGTQKVRKGKGVIMTFEQALVKYVETVQEVYNKHFAEHYDNLVPDLIQVEGGRKYVKISRTSDGGHKHGQTSVHSFICTEDDPKKNLKQGDILKPATWRAPARHARGNIYGKINLTATGDVPYLR